MTIFHILNTGKYSGAEHVVVDVIKNMPLNTDCIYVALKGPIESKLKELSIRYILLDKLSVSNIRNLIKKYKPSIIHAHDFTASVISSFFRKKATIISHIHNNNPFMRKWCIKSIIYYFTLRSYKKVLCVSNSIIDECIYNEKLRKKALVVGNPFDKNSIISQVSTYEKKWEICYVGRLSPEKNPLRFVEIIRQIKTIKRDINAIMIGDGSLRTQVEDAIKKYNLEDNIILLGFKDNPYDFMAKSKYLFLTSDWEGFGLVVLEALSLGLPCAVTNVGGVKKLIDNSCGCITNSDEEFLDFYLNCESNIEIYKDKCINAIKKADTFDNIQEYIHNLMEIYDFS